MDKEIFDRIDFERKENIKKYIGDVKPVITNLQTKLGRSDYEFLIDSIMRNKSDYQSEQAIRILFKLGANKKGNEMFDDYEGYFESGFGLPF